MAKQYIYVPKTHEAYMATNLNTLFAQNKPIIVFGVYKPTTELDETLTTVFAIEPDLSKTFIPNGMLDFNDITVGLRGFTIEDDLKVTYPAFYNGLKTKAGVRIFSTNSAYLAFVATLT